MIKDSILIIAKKHVSNVKSTINVSPMFVYINREKGVMANRSMGFTKNFSLRPILMHSIIMQNTTILHSNTECVIIDITKEINIIRKR